MSLPGVKLVVLATLLAAAAGQGGMGTERVDLYQGDAHLVHLDNTTFYAALLDQPHAWAVEFYKDWCGHCQRFAPVWSEVARRAKDWGTVIKVGALNCARRRNSAICREFGIHGVPHVKLFAPRVRRGNPGTSGIQHDPDKMTGAIVEFVTTTQRRERPEGWPELSQYSGSARQLLRNAEPLQALILEDPSGSMGRAVQLDLSAYQHLVRVSRTAHLPADLTVSPVSLPAMVLVRGDGGQQLVTAGPGEDPRSHFSAVIRQSIGAAVRPTRPPAVAPTSAPAPTPAPTRAPADMVFMVDMENAIVVALKQEVASFSVIEGDALEALRRFLRVLLDLFPGRHHVMASLSQVLRSITGLESVSGSALERLLRSSSPWWPGLPELQPYQACRGSKTKYRGYSCSLWTLFHTLTVQEYRNRNLGRNATVLPAVHGYVKHFFSCKDCSMHFQRMAAEDGLFDVYSTYDSLMWLWRAHNKVNARIAGDVTEDPLHPKRQFPDKNLCADCFNGEQVDTYNVFEFLTQLYAAENFRGNGLDPAPVAFLPSSDEFTSSDAATGQAAGESISTVEGETSLSSHQQASRPAPFGGQPITRQRPTPVRAQPSPDPYPAEPAPAPMPSLDDDQLGSSSVLVQTHRAPHLVRSRLPPPAVLPPLPGRSRVVPGIMRYPSEMTHVFPALVRAAPAGDAAQPRLEAGRTRTQRRVVYTKPRVVYTKPRVVYPLYQQNSQRRAVYPLYQHNSQRGARFPAQQGVQLGYGSSGIQNGGGTPVQSMRRSSHSVRTYWVQGNH